MRLKEIRLKRGLTQEEVAKIINVHQTIISKIEKGIVKLNNEQIIKLSIALEVTPNELLGFDEAYKSYTDYLISLKKEEPKN